MSVLEHELRVHGFHCDLYGHVNNARYLEFLEAARWEMLDATLDLDEWHERGRRFVIVRIDISYRAAATLGDWLRVESWGGEIRRTSAQVHQRILRAADGAVVAEADITYVILDASKGRPLRLAGELASTLGQMPGGPEEER